VIILLAVVTSNFFPRIYATKRFNGTEIYLIEKTNGKGPVVLFFNGGFGTRGGAKKILLDYSNHFNTTIASFKYRQSSFGGGELIDAVNAFEYFNRQNRSVIFVGKSHGGYLSLMAGTIVNCTAIVDFSGPTDLLTMEDFSLKHLYVPLVFSPLVKMTADECKGIPSQTPICYKEKSPVYRASEMKCPVMIIHGVNDDVVPYSQSVKMADALNESGKQFQFITTNSTHFDVDFDPYSWEFACEFISGFGVPCEAEVS